MGDDSSIGDWVLQVNVKIGDHLINIRGRSSDFVLGKLEELAYDATRIHAALEKLDGRPATEIAQKEKTWGARSQAGRTYPKTASGAPQAQAQTPPQQTSGFTAAPQQPAAAADPSQLLQQELGAQVVSTEVHDGFNPSVPREVTYCHLHNRERQYFAPGKSQKTGRDYAASYRCSERGCAAKPPKPLSLWQNEDGSWNEKAWPSR